MKSIEGATAIGVTYSDYGKLVQHLSTEILTLGDYIKANPREQPRLEPMIKELDEVLIMHRDALESWKEYVGSEPSTRELRLYPKVEMISLKYGMAEKVVSMRITQGIWEAIDSKLSNLSMAMYGRLDLTKEKPKSIAELRDAALAKKTLSDCISVENWNPDTRDRSGAWVIVGDISNVCGKPFQDVKLVFIV